MVDLEAIARVVFEMQTFTHRDDELRVVTQCLYPSNGNVVLAIRGGNNTFVVSDEGGAVAEARASGLNIPDTDRRIRRQIEKQGLRVDAGIIYSPPVGLAELGAAVMLVANASKEIAHWSYDNFKFAVRRNFREALAELLKRRFGQDQLRHNLPIPGASNKLYKFENVILLPGNRKLIIDPVFPDANSINARIVANLDVANKKDQAVAQRIVYDDQEEWTSENLSLLKVAAPVVPFSAANETIDRLAA